MKKIVFHISDKLEDQVNEAVKRWGFVNRPEFFRFAAMEFLRHDGRYMPADDTLKEHSKAIRSVKARQSIREDRMSWYDRKSENHNINRMTGKNF